MKKIHAFILLHVLLCVYSLGGIFSKNAAAASPLSLRFLLCYGGLLITLALYSVGWQQVIKHLPLTVAYATRAVTVAWGLLWSVLVFGESVNVGKLAAVAIIMAGVVLYAREEGRTD